MKLIKSAGDLPATFDLSLASNLTGYSIARLRQLARQGQFPAYKIGRAWLIDKDDYIKWIDELKSKFFARQNEIVLRKLKED